MVNFLLKSLSMGSNHATISLVQPSTKSDAETMIVAIKMYGLLRPHFDLLESARTPTIGWVMMPLSGPAIQTTDVWLFVNPRLRRYGVQYVISTPLGLQSAFTSQMTRRYCVLVVERSCHRYSSDVVIVLLSAAWSAQTGHI